MDPLSPLFAMPLSILTSPLELEDASPVLSSIAPEIGASFVVMRRAPDSVAVDSPMEYRS
jgi:hypothetical protein